MGAVFTINPDRKKKTFMNDILNKDTEAVRILVKGIASLIKTHEHKYDKTFSSAIKAIKG